LGADYIITPSKMGARRVTLVIYLTHQLGELVNQSRAERPPCTQEVIATLFERGTVVTGSSIKLQNVPTVLPSSVEDCCLRAAISACLLNFRM
jgi:hypothetical protein